MPEITVHDWIEIVGLIFAAGTFYQAMKSMKTDVTAIKADLVRLNQVVMDVALSNQRQDNFERSANDRFARMEEILRDLQHGRNLIRD